MKIAHVTFMKGISPGVKNRIIGMAQGLNKLGGREEVDFYFINNYEQPRNKTIHFVSFKERLFPFNYYDRLFCRYDLIEKSIDLKRYDYIILRYPLADASGIDFMARHQVISEHHTLELQHSKSFLNSKISPILRIAKHIRLNQEKKYGQKILENTRGIVGVTDEIRDFELGRSGCRRIPAISISNGILVDRINHTGFQPFNGKKLNLAMLVGSFYPWHGLDRIISGVENYQGNVDVRLHFIGRITRDDIRYPGLDFSKVEFHGFHTGSSLDLLMRKMNFAIGPLALHRVGLTEACTLKIREYTARGIPFVLAYKDIDLYQVDEDNRFYMECENSDMPVEMDAIIEFAARMSRKSRPVSELMRNYANKYMDWSAKMGKYLDFVKQIDAGGQVVNF